MKIGPTPHALLLSLFMDQCRTQWNYKGQLDSLNMFSQESSNCHAAPLACHSRTTWTASETTVQFK